MSSGNKLKSKTEPPNVSFKWSSTNRRLRIIIGVLAIALTVAGIIIIGLAAGLDDAKSSNNDGVCLDEECVQLASRILSSMDQSVDPCQDFYNFSCGRFEDNNVTPLDTGLFSPVNILARQNIRAFYNVLSSDSDNDIEAVVKAKDFYRLCLNTDQANAQSIQGLLDILGDTGGWPLIGLPGDGTPWDINGTQFMMEKLLGSPAFVDVSVKENFLNASLNLITIKQSGLSLATPAQYTNSTMTDVLRVLIVIILNRLNPIGDITSHFEGANGIVEVERTLASIFEDFHPVIAYNPFTLGILPVLSNYAFDWIGILPKWFATAGVAIDETETINVQTPMYIAQIANALEGFNAETLQNYTRWQFVRNFLTVLDSASVDAFMQFENTITNNGIPEREEMCVKKVQEFLPLAIWRPYAEFVFSDEARPIVAGMTRDIRAAFKERVSTQNWLDQGTIRRCQLKVDLMSQNIAYPDDIFDDSYLNHRYTNFQVFPGSLVRTVEEFQRFSIQQMFSRLRKPVSFFKNDIPGGPFAVNAFYRALGNEMVILSTIMHAPFFNPAWPDYFRFGALGYVIGHEITHGFDSFGRFFNETGQLSFTQWWTDASVANFEDRAQCFIDQYSMYKFYNFMVNGTQTLSENIADGGGIAVAYQAYKNFAARTGPDQPLPSVSYTQDQLFFIAAAQLYCTAYTPEGYRASAATDTHTPNRPRVLGIVSNSPEFAKAFQCAPGTPMNPRDKCALW